MSSTNFTRTWDASKMDSRLSETIDPQDYLPEKHDVLYGEGGDRKVTAGVLVVAGLINTRQSDARWKGAANGGV